MAISQIDPHLLAGLEDGSEEEYDEEYEEGEEGDEEYDGEDDSGDEEYNMRQFGINQALPIPDGEPNWDEPVDTVEEYLRRVRYEAQQRPSVVRVDIDPSILQRSVAHKAASASSPSPLASASAAEGTSPSDKSWMQPNLKWAASFLKDFSNLRQQLNMLRATSKAELAGMKLPPISNRKAWEKVFSKKQQGNVPAPASTSSAEAPAASSSSASPSPGDDGLPAGLGPVLRIMLALDQVSVNALLEWRVGELKQRAAISAADSQWMFALSAVLEKPLLPDACSCYYRLLHKAKQLRGQLAGPPCAAAGGDGAVQGDVVGSDGDAAGGADGGGGGGGDVGETLARLNLLVVLAGAYFGQDEQLTQLLPGDWQ